MDLDITGVRLRTTNREAITLDAGEAVAGPVACVTLATGNLTKATALAADAVFGLTVLPVDSGDEVPVYQDAILELVLGSGQTLPQGATVVASRTPGALALYQDLFVGDYLHVIGTAVEDNVLQVRIYSPGPVMGNQQQVLRPAVLTGNVDDADWGSWPIVELDGGAADRDVTGMLAMPDGLQRMIVNIGATNNIVIKNETTSVTTNRFHTVTGADLVLLPRQATVAYYSAGALNRWRSY